MTDSYWREDSGTEFPAAPLPTTHCAEHLTLLVVIVCYRAAELTVSCLRSLEGQINDVPGTLVAVCENGSGPDALHRLRSAVIQEGWSDWVLLVPSSVNGGFAAGNNLILRQAMVWPEPPDYFLLLNPDTIVHPGALRALHEAMEANPQIGIAGPRILSAAGQVQNSCFRDPSPASEFLRAAGTGALNRLFGRSDFELAPPRGATVYDWTSFACAIIRADVLRQVGLLDEGYFLYFEDPDYCRRARSLGWQIGHCPSATITHLEGGSNSVPSDTRARRRRPQYYYASRARYFAKFLGRAGLWAANLAWFAGRAIALAREAARTKRPHHCSREGSDLWKNWRKPVEL